MFFFMNVRAATEENTTIDGCSEAMPRSAVKKESPEDELRDNKTILSNYHCTMTTEDDCSEEHVGQQMDLLHQQLTTSAAIFTCDTCNRTFDKPHLLRAHRKLHQRNNSKTSVVPRTDVVSPSSHGQDESAKAKQKRLQTHTGNKPYQCAQCSAQFAYSSHLTRHKRLHTGEKPYQCAKCSAQFRQNSDLTRHKRVHTGERPYECTECEATFALSSNLNNHMKAHHTK